MFFDSDENFNSLYPEEIAALSRKHWTPLLVAKKASAFLAEKGAKVLDVGSGAGKFCLAAAYYHPEVKFTGIEQRAHLVKLSQDTAAKLNLNNVEFLHGNFTDLDFSRFNHFYFYNSFFENLDSYDRIDTSVDYSEELYQFYVEHLSKQLSQRPSGTKVVTYHSLQEEIPRSYKLVESFEDGDLNFWEKR